MDSALVPNQCGSHLQAELRKPVESPYHLYRAKEALSKTAEKRNWSLKLPSLPTWGGTGKKVAFWLQARPDHSDQ